MVLLSYMFLCSFLEDVWTDSDLGGHYYLRHMEVSPSIIFNFKFY